MWGGLVLLALTVNHLLKCMKYFSSSISDGNDARVLCRLSTTTLVLCDLLTARHVDRIALTSSVRLPCALWASIDCTA